MALLSVQMRLVCKASLLLLLQQKPGWREEASLVGADCASSCDVLGLPWECSELTDYAHLLPAG